MLTSRTDLQDGCQEAIEAAPILLLWTPPSQVGQGRVGKAAAIQPTATAPCPASKSHARLRGRLYDASSVRELLPRLRDISGALALLVLCLPLIVGLAIMIMLSDRGPPFFAHSRVGRNGKPFKCYKLRTMHRDAEKRLHKMLEDSPAMQSEWAHNRKLSRDPRVTWFGTFLRNSSLDELPQLFNIVDGTMSLVGPRPIVLEELQRYGRHADCYLRCKPGLTGLWQVSGRSDTSYRRRIAADRLYVRRRSFAFDWKLLLSTLPAVLTRKGAC